MAILRDGQEQDPILTNQCPEVEAPAGASKILRFSHFRCQKVEIILEKPRAARAREAAQTTECLDFAPGKQKVKSPPKSKNNVLNASTPRFFETHIQLFMAILREPATAYPI